MEDLTFRIGRAPGSMIAITYLRTGEADWGDFRADITLSPFSATIPFDTRSANIEEFAVELRALYESLAGTATLQTMERQIAAVATIDKLGHITWEIQLRPLCQQPLLWGTIEQDQSMLPPLLEELDAVVAALGTDGRTHCWEK